MWSFVDLQTRSRLRIRCVSSYKTDFIIFFFIIRLTLADLLLLNHAVLIRKLLPMTHAFRQVFDHFMWGCELIAIDVCKLLPVSGIVSLAKFMSSTFLCSLFALFKACNSLSLYHLLSRPTLIRLLCSLPFLFLDICKPYSKDVILIFFSFLSLFSIFTIFSFFPAIHPPLSFSKYRSLKFTHHLIFFLSAAFAIARSSCVVCAPLLLDGFVPQSVASCRNFKCWFRIQMSCKFFWQS